MAFHVTGQQNQGIDQRLDFFNVVWGGPITMLGEDIEKVASFDNVDVYIKGEKQERRTIEKLEIVKVEYYFYNAQALMRIAVETAESPFAMLEQKFWPVTSPYWKWGKLNITIPPYSNSFLMTHRPTWERWQCNVKQRYNAAR